MITDPTGLFNFIKKEILYYSSKAILKIIVMFFNIKKESFYTLYNYVYKC